MCAEPEISCTHNVEPLFSGHIEVVEVELNPWLITSLKMKILYVIIHFITSVIYGYNGQDIK